MQTERGKPNYPLPNDFGRAGNAIIDERQQSGHYVMLMFIEYGEMRQMLEVKGHLGVPTLASIGDGCLWLFPTPDAAYNVVARYEPALKEF